MPVSLTEWRVRIGRFIQNPPDINKREMIQRFLDRWKAKKEKAKTAAEKPSTQDQTPCKSAEKENSKVAASQPSTQTSCPPETSSCTAETNLVPPTIRTGSVVLSCITQVLLTLLTLMTTSFQWCRKQYSSTLFGQNRSPAETSLPPKAKVFLTTSSCFSRGLHFCRSMISYTIDGFCHLYRPMNLLMRSGDIETNPGPSNPERTISEMEFLKLARDIHPSYYIAVGISLGIPHAHLEATLIEKLNNYTNALLNVFMKWNAMQQPPYTNKREVLADKLGENDLGDLSDRLRNGRLLPNSKGRPSRPPESQTQPLSAESQTEPLSPELIERCAKDFKSKYRSTLCKIRADPLNPASLVGFEKLYTNLVLEEEDGTGKQILDYKDFCDFKVNGEFPRRLMVQGEAGAGKTTLCAKIAWDWIEGRHFSHFVWVLIVPLRDAKQYTLGQIAKSHLAKNNPATACQLAEYIQSNPDKVFIACDGLDEFSSKVTKEDKDGSHSDCRQTQSNDKMQLRPSQPRVDSSEAYGGPSHRTDIGLVEILCSDQLASCPVLVTTRPWRAVEIRSDGDLMNLYTFIHVEGFSRENLSVYIHKYFRNNVTRANQLIQFTNDNDVISENMAHYPIYIAMLCLMWKELDEQKLKEIKTLQTFSQIFKKMTDFLKEHYAQKKIKKVGSPSLNAYLKKIDKLLEPIAKQAFNGLLENTLIFSEDDFQICTEAKDTACRVGILSQEDRITSTIDIHQRNSHMLLPVFFPHKLFQEYMAGVYLASLYKSDSNEFNRLIEQEVLPRKEEFRYLLYFTVSQSKSIANHVMNSMLLKSDMSGRDRDIIVDIAFESQDLDVAALVKERVSSQMRLTINSNMTAHTVSGYAFTRPPMYELIVERHCGRTVSLDVAEMICSSQSLQIASLERAYFHDDFFPVLAKRGKESNVLNVWLGDVKCPTTASSHYLAEAVCSMPNLTDLTLDVEHLNEEFYSTLKTKASSIQARSVTLNIVRRPTPASSHHLVEALCSMPYLNDLTLRGMNRSEEFCSILKAKASSIKIQTLYIPHTPAASSHDLAEALCSMPNLTDLTLGGRDLNSEFCSVLKAKASCLQIQTLNLQHAQFSTPASSHYLVEALCSMPNLTDLKLNGMDRDREFCSTLKAKASSIQIQALEVQYVQGFNPASSHDLAEALCSMPNLTDLRMCLKYTMDFCSILKAKASSIQGCFPQIRTRNFRFNGAPLKDLNSFLDLLAAIQRYRQRVLAYRYSSIPLSMLSANCPEQLITNTHTLYQMPPCTRDITGTNPIPQPTCTLPRQPLGGSYQGNTGNTSNVSSEQQRAMYQDDMASTSSVNPVYANISVSPYTIPRGLGTNIPVLQGSHDNVHMRQPLQKTGTLRNQTGSHPVYWRSNTILGNPRHSQPQFMPFSIPSGMSTGYCTTAPHQTFSDSTFNHGHREPYYDPSHHTSKSSHAPSPNPQVSQYDQATMFTGCLAPRQYQSLVPDGAGSTTVPVSNQAHYTQSYHVSTSSSAPLCNPPVSEYHQPARSIGHHSVTQYQPSVQEGAGSTNRPGSVQPYYTPPYYHPLHAMVIPTMSTRHNSATPYQPVVQERTDTSSRPGSSSQISHSTNFLFPNQSASNTAGGHIIHSNDSSDTVSQFSQQNRSYKRRAPSTLSRVDLI